MAVVLVAAIASVGCAKPPPSKVNAGEPGIPLDFPTGDFTRDLLLGSFAESAVPAGSGVEEAAGRRALDVSRAAIELRNAAPLYTYGQDPAAMASIEKAGHTAAQVMTAVSRNLDGAQALVGDRDFRRGLLLTQHLDDSGAVALLERATARTAPTAADADENARIAHDLFVDLAQDPHGWREEIPKGSAISDTIAMTVAEHIDAFSTSETRSGAEMPLAAQAIDGYLSELEPSGGGAADVLTFVAAGREPGAPDRDLIALHTASQAYTRHQIVQAIEGPLDPSTALAKAGRVANAVNTADFRSAMHAHESVDAASSAVYDNVSAVYDIPLGRAGELAAGAAPGWVGDALSAAVDKAAGGFEPEATADWQRTLEHVLGREKLDFSRLIVSAYQQAGALPADTPDLDAVTDQTGQVAALDSFRDDQVDPDVTGDDLGSQHALAQIARQGAAGGNPLEWRDALAEYRDAASLKYAYLDYVNPEPRVPLNSDLVDNARRSGRYGDPIPWPLANPMTFPPDTSTPIS
ncbi:hypothetical protein K1T35_29335 [Pseudonocardia sp. DSM 110487]|uniref:hypothetical protein n=1 Tax=Pseudonocardia sp. DSM 110487 TaxID=2865833 RepID=UPI001C69C736|nr:hypothetical protein [Pseudonocardia sp. DSM 110487]QYN32657.1 hypothetical protein K1T35_29335 [Pseudonocardia sp. DSM 110487]